MSRNSEQPDYRRDKKPQEYPGHTSVARQMEGAPADGSFSDGKTLEADLTTTSTKVKEASLFRNRNFMLLWIAQAVTQTAQNTLNLALVDYVTRLTKGSPSAAAIETVAFVLPGVFFSALAGVFVDRFNKRHILIITNLLRALIVPWLVFMGNIPIAIALPIIFLITCLFSTISQFFGPAEGAMIPLLVTPGQLTRANSFFQITFFGAMFVGFSILAPLLPRIIGPENLFIAISVLYGICFLLVWWLPDNVEKPIERKDDTRSMISNIWKELKEGWAFIRKERQIWLAIVYLSTVQTALFIMTAIGIPYVGEKGLNQPQGDIIWVLAPISIGLGVSVVFVNRLVTPHNRSIILVLATVALGINVVIVGLIKPLSDLWIHLFGGTVGGPGLITVLVIFSIPFGMMIGLLNISSLTVLQEQSPKEIVGRVFAAYFTFANFVTIFPILFAGALGDLIGLVPVFIIVGILIALVGYYGWREDHKSIRT
jgi:MFS family permease